jgi:hypothetical protein
LVPGIGPATTTKAEELCASADVDVVFVANVDEYHTIHVLLALQHGKHVFVEKPMSLNFRDADAIIEAEKRSQGLVMVGYMRRFESSFLEVVKEIGGSEKITYARVRGTSPFLGGLLTFQDIIGPNSYFVQQSGTFPKRFTDFKPKDIDDLNLRRKDILDQGIAKECGLPLTPENISMWRLLGRQERPSITACPC